MSQGNPYQPPPYVPQKPPADPHAVTMWFKVYAGAFAVIYLLCLIGGIMMLVAGVSLDMRQDDRVAMIVQGIILPLFSAPLSLLFIYGVFAPRTKFGYIINMVCICFGLTSPCCMPASIPLLIFYLKPEVKAHFGMKP